MLKLNSLITINGIEFNFTNTVGIESSWQNLTDIAKIIIPRKIQYQGRPIVAGEDSLFRRGDSVKIELGYRPNLTTVFEGYISKITPRLPIEIECEDEMWKFKQVSFNASFSNTNLKELVDYIFTKVDTDISREVINATLGKFRISNASGAQIFEELRKTYSIQTWIRNGVLYSGLAYLPDLREEHIFKFQQNIISDELEYKRIDDVKIKLKAISITDNKKIEVEVGDAEGEQRTMHYYGLSESELREIAEREIDLIRYEGYSGSFTTFGEPFVNHGDGVRIIDEKLPEREGLYLVKKVTREFGMNGYRQKIELDRKI